MSWFSRRRPADCVVVAGARFDGELTLTPVAAEPLALAGGHDLILQVAFEVEDTHEDEHWRIQFRAGLGDEGDARGPAVFDLVDRHHRVDSTRGTIEQRLSLPAGRHEVAFTVEAFYSAEPWDKHIVHEREASDRLDGSLFVTA